MKTLEREKRCTAADVAALAGVDTSTVSRVLNRSFAAHAYAPQTIRIIEESARKLGYRPLLTARALRGKRTQLLGLVVSDIANAFFGELAAAIEQAVRPMGYLLAICNTNEDPSTQAEHLDSLLARGVDGLIVSPSGDAGFEKLIDYHIPFVTIDREVTDAKITHVATDNLKAGNLLGAHLRSLGYRKVLAAGPIVEYDATIDQRIEGLRMGLGSTATLDLCRTRNKPFGPVLAEKINGILRGRSRPDALVGLTNDSTIAAIDAIKRTGIKMPEQIGIAGIDAFSAATILNPAITIVEQPIAAIAQLAANRLMDLLNHQKIDVRISLLEPQLIKRQSLIRQPYKSGN